MNNYFEYTRPDRDDDAKYHSMLLKLQELSMKDSVFVKDLDDCIELEDLIELLPISDYSRLIFHDYIACLLSLSERQTELAYDLGKEEMKAEL